MPQRTPLAPISRNRQRGPDLSPYIRGKIATLKECGVTTSAISRRLSLPRSTIQSTLDLDEIRNNGESQPRIGRPLSYTPSDERRILRTVRAYPKLTYHELISQLGLEIHPNTVKKILKEHGRQNWKCKRRPFLTPALAAKRLAWCLEHKDWRAEEWGMVVWSDECSVERGRGKRDEYAFRTSTQKWLPQMVQTYNAKKNMKVMVWGAFWDDGRSNLYIMDRDFESQKHGYSAQSYLEVLDGEVAGIFERLDLGYEFMQDNAPIHTAYVVRDWFAEKAIRILANWPPHSPDLNPIEHIWWHLKARVYEMFPDVAADKSETEYARQRLESCLQAAWDTLDKGLFDNLYQSMPRRIAACIEAGGWHTKY
jgi:Transposase/DDE superfamily endonuclease